MTVITKENCFLHERCLSARHTSGLSVYLIPKKLSSSYAVIGTKYGSLDSVFRASSRDEAAPVPDGIAHFLEHKMFENEDGADAFAEFAKFGADANAFTTFDKTAYLFSCTEHFSKSLSVLLNMVTHPYFTSATVKKEQGIIAQEIRMCEDRPERALLFETLRSLYAVHPVHTEVAGTVASISQITPELLYRCYHTFYNLNNMALCVSGDVTMDEILAVCDACLAPSSPFTAESVMPQEPEAVARAHFSRNMDVAKPLFAIGIKDNNISADSTVRVKKDAAISILCDMIFGRCSRFYNDLYEEGLLSSSFDLWTEHNRRYSFALLSGEADQPSVIYQRFLDYVESVKKNGLGADDFDRCRRSLYADFVKSFDSTDEIANNLLSFVFEGYDLLTYPSVVEAVTLDDVNEVFRDLFRPEHFTLTELFPIREKERTDAR